MTDNVAWQPVQEYLYRLLGGITTHITAGTSEWADLDDADHAKLAAVLVAGSRRVLEQEMNQRTARRAAQKQAAEAISDAIDWNRVAREIRDRDQFYRDHPDLKWKAS